MEVTDLIVNTLEVGEKGVEIGTTEVVVRPETGEHRLALMIAPEVLLADVLERNVINACGRRLSLARHASNLTLS